MTTFHSAGSHALVEEAQAIHRLLLAARAGLNVDVTLTPEPQPGSVWVGDAVAEALPPGDGNLVIYTSGTTGPPKARRHRWSDLFRRARPPEPGARWLLCYSPLRWAGLSVMAHAVSVGAELVIPRALDVRALVEAAPRATHISMTPSLLRKMATLLDGAATHGVQQLTFGGEWASQSALDLAKDLFPQARVSHVYASTEFGDICSVSDGLAGFPLARMKGATLSEQGELSINGVGTADFWELRDGRLHFSHRQGGEINVGGAMVSPALVEEAALSLPGVSEAVAYPIKNALLGQAVALDYAGDAPPEAMRAHLCDRLERVSRPLRVRHVEQVAMTSAGKIARETRP